MKCKQSHSRCAERVVAGCWRQMFAVVVLLVFLGGCEKSGGLRITAEVDEPHYRRGLQMARSGQPQVALEAFLKVIEKRGGDAPESHFEAAQIYRNHIKDPIAAIYHYRKNLELRPNSPQAPQVWQLIETAKKQFATTLAGEPLTPGIERLDLLDALEKLKAENASLRTELARIGRQQPPPPSAIVTQTRGRGAETGADGAFAEDPFASQEPRAVIPIPGVAQAPQAAAIPEPAGSFSQPTRPPSGRTYVVQAKDTLYGISVKVYGSGARWQAILDANRDQLRTHSDLKPGMVLTLP